MVEREVMTIQQGGQRWSDALAVTPAAGPGEANPLAVYLASLRPGPVAQPVQPLGVEPGEPLPHGLRVTAELGDDGARASAVPAAGDHPPSLTTIEE